MADHPAEEWIGQVQEAFSERVDRWSDAIESLAALERRGTTRTEVEQVGMAFVRFLTGTTDAGEMVETVRAAEPDAFWAALEAFESGVSGEEWRLLTSQLLQLPAVKYERGRLRELSSWRRALAARRLGLLTSPELSEPLRRVMARGPERVTLTAALALARLGDEPGLSWLLEHPDATAECSRRQLVVILMRFGREALPALRAAAAGWNGAAPIHRAAIDVLGMREDLESPRILEGLVREAPFEARLMAARALGRIGSHESLAALIAALDDEAWQVRAQAARALGSIPDYGNVQALAARVGDVEWWVRKHAAYALGRHGAEGRRALEQLADGGHDQFAADMSREVLQRLEWEDEVPGGFARVA
ncbi:MAG TPA: HEAT repeat domain-containing protein [Candidatus Eisenbacteria bacterium]|jgi:HEAT repeat protein